MSVKAVTTYYGVCDRCGAEDDDGRLTAEEAKERMWPNDLGSGRGEDLCWDCVEADGVCRCSHGFSCHICGGCRDHHESGCSHREER